MSRVGLTIILFIFGLFLPWSYISAGTVLNSHTYAWSDNVGYINFGNVTVGDSALTGHAWSANKGFIKFHPTQGGVFNDGTGNLSGSAWGEQLGWIDFNNVAIDPTTGKFSGTATGTLVGTITFDCPTYCDVQTDWRQSTSLPTPITVTPPSGGGGGGGGGSAPLSTITQTPVATPTALVPESVESAQSAQAKLIDILKDGVINILDFNALMVAWGSTTCGNQGDTNTDCLVDIFDFNVLMVYWGITYQI